MMKGQECDVLMVKTQSKDCSPERTGHSVLVRIVRWWKLHRERVQLASLSDDHLKDIGLSRADVYQESERPFWDDPMKR